MQTNPNRAPLFVRRRLRCYIKGGALSRVALYQGWRYIKGRAISMVAIYQGWRFIKDGDIFMEHFRSQTYRSAKRGWRYIGIWLHIPRSVRNHLL